MPIIPNPNIRIAKPGERWRLDPIRTGGPISALLSHHVRKTGGIGRQLLDNEQQAIELTKQTQPNGK